jgi:hypothetical protein
MTNKQRWMALDFKQREELLKQIWASHRLASLEAAYKWDRLLPSTQQKISAIWNQGPADR